MHACKVGWFVCWLELFSLTNAHIKFSSDREVREEPLARIFAVRRAPTLSRKVMSFGEQVLVDAFALALVEDRCVLFVRL